MRAPVWRDPDPGVEQNKTALWSGRLPLSEFSNSQRRERGLTASEFAWIRSELRALVRTRTIPVRRRERPNPARDTAFFTRGGEPEPVVTRRWR